MQGSSGAHGRAEKLQPCWKDKEGLGRSWEYTMTTQGNLEQRKRCGCFQRVCVGGVRGTETWSLWFLPLWAEPSLKPALGTRNLSCEVQSVTCWGRIGHSWDKTCNWSTIVV